MLLVRTVNVLAVELDESLCVGHFRHAQASLRDHLGSQRIGATVYEAVAGHPIWPYHYHHGVEEWLYVISGKPLLREPAGERELAAGDVVCFPTGPEGTHTLTGPGRFALFSTGDHVEPWLSVYPDSEKISTPEGMLLLDPTLDYWHGETAARENPAEPSTARPSALAAAPRPVVNLDAVNLEPTDPGVRGSPIGTRLGAERLAAALVEVDPGSAAEAFHYEYGRESWIIVLGGRPSVRRARGEDVLAVGDVTCFGEGPDGARQLINRSGSVARAMLLSTQGVPSQGFYPDSGSWRLRNGGGKDVWIQDAD